ncbi:hypothetical protein I6E74_12960 [Salinibacterium sp. SWN139]|uniref:hypothetical protein n=1 Tax=Salinibacterium sp. SWN139 TaxID=2792055 RepID=UPI0018CDA253|nr:hypothetical protein [Salinibacterium sp. SWN139]MBH0055074.1 hypothetical protein [Salinibacterium sp. SWN139]
MRRLLSAAVCAGILIPVSACTPVEPPPPSESSSSAASTSAEDGNVGLCHSLSIELTTLEGVVSGYETGELDRESFDYVIATIAGGFPVLGILHNDATLSTQVDDLRSAIKELAADGSEPAVGDASALGEATTALAVECDAVGAPLSIYQQP